MLTRVQSALPPELEDLAHRTIGCLITVHRLLGPGYREAIYQRALCLELELQRIRFECEKKVLVPYRSWQIPGHKVDLIIESQLLLELKSVPRLKDLHRRQVVSYLKATGLPLGLLVNFNAAILKGNIRRVVNWT
jgi:GxxExxY protein